MPPSKATLTRGAQLIAVIAKSIQLPHVSFKNKKTQDYHKGRKQLPWLLLVLTFSILVLGTSQCLVSSPVMVIWAKCEACVGFWDGCNSCRYWIFLSEYLTYWLLSECKDNFNNCNFKKMKYISFHSFKPETLQRALQMGGSFEMKFNINGLNHVTLLVGQYFYCSNSAKCKMHSHFHFLCALLTLRLSVCWIAFKYGLCKFFIVIACMCNHALMWWEITKLEFLVVTIKDLF